MIKVLQVKCIYSALGMNIHLSDSIMTFYQCYTRYVFRSRKQRYPYKQYEKNLTSVNNLILGVPSVNLEKGPCKNVMLVLYKV